VLRLGEASLAPTIDMFNCPRNAKPESSIFIEDIPKTADSGFDNP